MKIEILVPYNKNKIRSEHYNNTTIMFAIKGNMKLDIFTEGCLTCYLPENKDYLHFNFISIFEEHWIKYKGDSVEYKLKSDEYTDDEITELNFNDMFIDSNWFAWTLTDIEKNEVISDENDVLDTYDDCLDILNQFIKGEI